MEKRICDSTCAYLPLRHKDFTFESFSVRISPFLFSFSPTYCFVFPCLPSLLFLFFRVGGTSILFFSKFAFRHISFLYGRLISRQKCKRVNKGRTTVADLTDDFFLPSSIFLLFSSSFKTQCSLAIFNAL
jgi:hypothetical protein